MNLLALGRKEGHFAALNRGSNKTVISLSGARCDSKNFGKMHREENKLTERVEKLHKTFSNFVYFS